MKNVLIILLCFASVSIAFGQTALADGDNCFDNGDYSCAVLKYREAMNIATGRDKQMAEIKLTRAQSCSEWLTNANRAFNSRDYKVAKENYELVIEENPNDIFAKLQLEKIEQAITDARQKLLEEGDACFNRGDYECAQVKYQQLVNALTGNEKQTIEGKLSRARSCGNWLSSGNRAFNSRNYQLAIDNYELLINENPNDTYARTQLEKSIEALKNAITLTVSTNSLQVSTKKNLEVIRVSTNADEYQITNLPTWCRVVNKAFNRFSIEINENQGIFIRSGWFKVVAGDKEEIIYISQDAKKKRTATHSSYNSFFAVGYEGGEIANYGIRVEFGGTRFVGMFLNARSSFTSDRDILDSYGWFENKNEAVLGVNLKVTRSVFINLGGGYGFYKYRGFDNTLEQIDYYPAYGGLTFRLGRRINLSGGASFEDIEQSFNTNVFRPEYTVGLTINLRK